MSANRLDLSLYKPGLEGRIIKYVQGSVAHDVRHYLDIDLPAIDVRLCGNRDYFDKEFFKRAGFKPDDTVGAYSVSNNSSKVNPKIFLMNPQLFRFSFSWPSVFWRVFKHECIHVACKCLTASGSPNWLFEGVADHIADFRLAPEQETYFVFDQDNRCHGVSVYSVINPKSKTRHAADNYLLGRFWVGALARRFGWKAIRQLIVSLDEDDDRGDFVLKFYDAFGTPFTKKGLQSIFRSVSKGSH